MLLWGINMDKGPAQIYWTGRPHFLYGRLILVVHVSKWEGKGLMRKGGGKRRLWGVPHVQV